MLQSGSRFKWPFVVTIVLLSLSVAVWAIHGYWFEIAYERVVQRYDRKLLTDFSSSRTDPPDYIYFRKRWKFLPGDDIVSPPQLCGVCAVAAADSFAHKLDCLDHRSVLLEKPWPRPVMEVPSAERMHITCTCDHPDHAEEDQ